MIRLLFSFVLAAVVAVGIYIMAPSHLKQQMLASISNLIPQAVKEKVEPIIYSPAQQRQRIIDQLRANTESAKTALTEAVAEAPDLAERVRERIESIVEAIEENEQLIQKIEESNTEQSTVNKITTTIVEKIVEIAVPKKEEAPPANTGPTCPCNAQ